ncbi:hypothetical protein JL722_11544 [Aureococcus anophagefferens]|nr:hypothetical protein JL722_11544 [Aureococcus anophagefferens]
MDDDDDDDDERPIEEGGAGRRYGWPLFFLATVFGAVSWTTTAAVVLELKRSLGTSVASTVEIALFTTLETLLVKDMGAIWTAISGVALIPLLWLTELVAHYAFDAFFGVSWTTPDSWCQLAALFALVLGAVIY